MPVTVDEKFESRRTITGPNASVELVYVISGTDDDLIAKAELAAASPPTYDGLQRQSLQIEPLANDVWEGVVRYGRGDDEDPPTGESSFAFETGGGTQHITQSLATVGVHAPAGVTPPNFGGAVGVATDSVEGVDVNVPVFNFSETHVLDDSVVTQAYKGILFSLTGKVNDAPFKGLAAGECLFLGASGSKRGSGDWEITFRFAGSPNATNLTVGPITGISKTGWDYLWVRYADVEDENAQMLVKRPIAAYVERVYERASFAGLGIGA